MTYSFTYNALGQRTGINYSYVIGNSTLTPVQNGDVTAYSKAFYYDQAGRLVSETNSKTLYGVGNEYSEIVYLYDESSMVGMIYTSPTGTSTIYYYLRNLQGDVIAIYDSNGNLKVKYNYDAWGNCTVSSETDDYVLARVNPIRYRGYYYDTDTGLYYLNARYYNPQWRRFISPDSTDYLDPETPNGLNLYCYCNNDPVNYADPSGHFAISLVAGLVIGGLVTWGLSELFGEHLVTGAGLAITGGSAIISGMMAMSLFTPVGWIVGGVTAVAGIVTMAFATAELQQHFTGNNWMLDTGMNEGAYYTLMTVSSIVASVGTAASSITFHYKLNSVVQRGRMNGKMISGKDIDGYPGLRFSSETGKVYSFEFHPNHNDHGIHIQWNQWMQNYPKFPGVNVLKPLWRFRIW